MIAGVHSFEDFQKMGDNSKFLILGYKEFGFGTKFKEKSWGWEDRMNSWLFNLPKLMSCKKTVSFDNLAIRQLNLRKYFSKESWEKLYMGDDGEFSFYVDAVKKEYGLNSCAEKRFPIEGGAGEMFKKLKQS